MQDVWRLGTHRGSFAAVIGSGANRRRHKIDAPDEAGAKAIISRMNAELARVRMPAELTVAHIFDFYISDRRADGKSVKRMEEASAAVGAAWGSYAPDQLTKSECRTYIARRRARGVSNGAIRTELAYLTAALNFAVDTEVLKNAPKIFKPPPGRPREHHLERDQAIALINGAEAMHAKLSIILMLAMAARPSHVLQLTWNRIDFAGRIANLDDPARDQNKKARPRVPLNDEALEALRLAREIAETSYVIEYHGKSVASVKKAIREAAKRARVKASPYVLRHTGGVWMAQAGVPLEKIAEYMGHSSIDTTRKHYARFHPAFLRDAAEATQIMRGSAGTMYQPGGTHKRLRGNENATWGAYEGAKDDKNQ